MRLGYNFGLITAALLLGSSAAAQTVTIGTPVFLKPINVCENYAENYPAYLTCKQDLANSQTSFAQCQADLLDAQAALGVCQTDLGAKDDQIAALTEQVSAALGDNANCQSAQDACLTAKLSCESTSATLAAKNEQCALDLVAAKAALDAEQKKVVDIAEAKKRAKKLFRASNATSRKSAFKKLKKALIALAAK